MLNGFVLSAQAASLPQDYDLAYLHDPGFAAALTERQSTLLQARIASMAYYPQARLSATQLDNETETRQTMQIVQPLIDIKRWITLKEVEPRQQAAELTLQQQEHELARQLYKIVSGYVTAREDIALNAATIHALNDEVKSAEQRFERGIGTVTDLYDTRLRLTQARADQFAYQAALEAASRQYEAVTGISPDPHGYAMAEEQQAFELSISLTAFLEQAQTHYPQLKLAQLKLELSQLAYQRTRAELLPSVNAYARRSLSGGNGVTSSGVIVSLELPLDASRIFSYQGASLDIQRAQDQARSVEQQVVLDIERLYRQVLATQNEINTLKEAIQAAQLSVEATERSFVGGVRTKIDVINSILALQSIRRSEIAARLRLADYFLQLQLQGAVKPRDALQQVQALLFKAS